MAAMSRNSSSSSLMGFSVSQPFVGAALQFFPAMGSKELDEMIDAYVPGTASIQDKRAAVSLEFFHHSIQTGETFKFFLVYPTMDLATASPASSAAMQDSGYGSSFNTSPVTSELQWAPATTPLLNGARHSKARVSSRKASSPSSSRSQMADFSSIPGMKILTKDGVDVTNSASRGCKTKEQREHAHLMRIIKACDECKRKKVRCDPSHKKRGSAQSRSPESRVTKKVKKSASPPAQKKAVVEAEPFTPAPAFLDSALPEQLSFDDSFVAPQAQVTDDWDQFVQYDDPLATVEPLDFDFDFFVDPSTYFSPTTSKSTSVSPTEATTPSELITPTGKVSPTGKVYPTGRIHPTGKVYADIGLLDESGCQEPTLPYMNPRGVDLGNNYVDFNLYSPSSTSLDEDPAFSKEFAASPRPQDTDYLETPSVERNREFTFTDSQLSTFNTTIEASQETHTQSPSTSSWCRQRHSPQLSVSSQVDREDSSEEPLRYTGLESRVPTMPGVAYVSTSPSPTSEPWVPGGIGVAQRLPTELPRPRGWRVAIGPSIQQSSETLAIAASDLELTDSSQLTRFSQLSRSQRAQRSSQDETRTITRHRSRTNALETERDRCSTDAATGDVDSGSRHQRSWHFYLEDSTDRHLHSSMKHAKSSTQNSEIAEDTASKVANIAKSSTITAVLFFMESPQNHAGVFNTGSTIANRGTKSPTSTASLLERPLRNLGDDHLPSVTLANTPDSFATKDRDFSQSRLSPVYDIALPVFVMAAILAICMAMRIRGLTSATWVNLLNGLGSIPIVRLLWSASRLESATTATVTTRLAFNIIGAALLSEVNVSDLIGHQSWHAYRKGVYGLHASSSVASYPIATWPSSEHCSSPWTEKLGSLIHISSSVRRLVDKVVRSVNPTARGLLTAAGHICARR